MVNMTIVISDIHLGIDDEIAETMKNRSLIIDSGNEKTEFEFLKCSGNEFVQVKN